MQILIHVDSQDAMASLENLGLTKKGPYILRDLLNGLAKRVQGLLLWERNARRRRGRGRIDGPFRCEATADAV